MSETLGSLVDKLSIKNIREFHLKKMSFSQTKKKSPTKTTGILKLLKRQKALLLDEIEEFLLTASQRVGKLREEKLKLYNHSKFTHSADQIRLISQAIDRLSIKNLELWQLEDQARREDVSLSVIGKVKRKIDIANQERNDLIDKIDELFSLKFIE